MEAGDRAEGARQEGERKEPDRTHREREQDAGAAAGSAAPRTRRRRVLWIWLTGGAVSVLLWFNRRLFTVNDVTTGQSTAYPDLQPQSYPIPPSQVFALAEAAARDMPRWRVTSVDRTGWELQAEAQTPVGGFIDDITIRVTPASDGRSEVIVRSRSRKGIGDLGENARRIRAYYRSLDDRYHNAVPAAAPPSGV